MPTTGAQAFLVDYTQGVRVITHHAGPVQVGVNGGWLMDQRSNVPSEARNKEWMNEWSLFARFWVHYRRCQTIMIGSQSKSILILLPIVNELISVDDLFFYLLKIIYSVDKWLCLKIIRNINPINSSLLQITLFGGWF
jgi:hypothetical protein